MADNLIFPIGFDLQKAVEEAGQNWDKKYAGKLEAILAKRPVKVKLDFENLTDVKTRLAQLKIEPITPETKSAIKELARELQVLAKALEQVQKYSSKSVGTAEVRGARVDEIEAKAAAARELARQRAIKAEQAELKLAAAREKAAAVANKTTTAVNNLTKAYGNQTYYIERLLKKMVAVWSIQQVQNFLTNVREVTAQFELQRVSLGAIIQDANKASQLFSQIKSFALKSPVSIMDLTKYTKQVAAYGVETEKLFDTTKMLTDVSVGLGTDMARATLFFGQVFATGYLRASELRQATEMGIPLVDKLAKKLEELNGRGYTAAEVMDLISKRAISFEMVEEVFKDMTSAGGQFYNMQEKQGNTLFGLWAKLGDAASVMYDEIGNTESVNNGMKKAIGLLTELMRNWKAVANTAQWFILPNAAIFALYKYSTANQRVEAAQSAAAAATERRKAAVLQLSAAIEKGSVDDINAANAALQKAKADEVAAQKATTRMGLLKSGFVSVAKSIGAGLGIGLAITAVTTLVYKLFEAYENAHRLDRKLNEIDAERITLTSQSVRNFEYLADVAVKAADGSKKQKDALDELKRTYKDMIPVQDLTIEHLRKLREGTNSASEAYKSLTTAIREYISEQQKQKKLSAIEEEYGATITDSYKQLSSILAKGFKTSRWSETFKMSEPEIERFFYELEKRANQAGKSINQKIKESLEAAGVQSTATIVGYIRSVGSKKGLFSSYMEDYIDNVTKLKNRTQAVQEAYAGFTGDLGKYGAEMNRIAEVMETKIYKFNGKVLESTSFLRKQMQSNAWIKEWTNSIKTNLSAAGVEVKNEWFNFIQSINPSDPNTISSINFDAILDALNTDAIREKLGDSYEQTKNYILAIQKEYSGLVPQDRTVAVLRAKLTSISTATGVSMDKLQHYWMNADESIEDYAKRIKGTIEDLQKTILEMQQVNADKEAMKPGSLLLKGYSEEEIKQANALLLALQQLFAGLQGFAKSSGSGRKSDPRLQNLKEEISLVQKLYNEYKQLEKQEGASKAAEDMRRMAGGTLDMFKEKYDIDLPTDAKDLTAALEILYAKMAQLPKKVFPALDKDLKELRWTIEKVNIDESQKNIEAELKRLAERISRTKTAREFYEKILSTTGDHSLASKVAESIFGQNGSELRKALADQVRGMTNGIALPEGIISADNVIDYKALRKFAEANKTELGGMYAELVKISEQGQKDLAKTYEGYLKDLERAKSYSDKRIELARYTANQIAEIEASAMPKEEKERLTAGYRERERRKQGELEWEAFKDMPIYVQMFADLDNASETMLSNMKAKLTELQSVWGSTLNPTQLKELQSRLSEIDTQLAKKNPFKTLSEAMKQYQALSKGGTQGDAERGLIEATKKREAAQRKLNMALDVSRTAQERYNDAVAEYGNNSEQAKSAKLFWDAAKQGVDDAGKLVEQTGLSEKEAQRLVNAWEKVKYAIGISLGEVFQIAHSLGDLAGGIGKLTGVFGGDEEDVQYWNDIANSLNEVTSGIENMVQAALSGNPIGIVTSAVTAIPNMISGFAGLFSAGKVRKANKKIKRQQEILEQLEYTYDRLNSAADKLFGVDYLQNHNQQIKVLQAQQAAYLKQAEAERSKGKKEDKEKTQEYLDQARDVADQIKEMQDDLVAQIVGTDVASAARDFANAWLDAYLSFGSTTDAIKEKFDDMIKNMIVNMVLAQVVKRALDPIFKMIDDLAKDGELSGEDIAKVMSKVPATMTQINDGLSVGVKALEAAGVDLNSLRENQSGFTGIAKDIAGATSEEINAVATIGNTMMYHTSHIPVISENVAMMRQLMERGTVELPTAPGVTATTDYTSLFTTANQHLSTLPTMERHLSEIRNMLSDVITLRGGISVINTVRRN